MQTFLTLATLFLGCYLVFSYFHTLAAKRKARKDVPTDPASGDRPNDDR